MMFSCRLVEDPFAAIPLPEDGVAETSEKVELGEIMYSDLLLSGTISDKGKLLLRFSAPEFRLPIGVIVPRMYLGLPTTDIGTPRKSYMGGTAPSTTNMGTAPHISTAPSMSRTMANPRNNRTSQVQQVSRGPCRTFPCPPSQSHFHTSP